MTTDLAGKVLLVMPDEPDYLALTLFHGFRSLLGSQAVDYPRCDVAYADFPASARASIYGRGFSAFYLLPEASIDRIAVASRVASGQFKLVVFTSIQRQFGLFLQWRPFLSSQNTIITDSEDTPQPYPAAGRYWRRPYCWFLPRAHRQFLYFKREWTPDTQFNLWHRLVPRSYRRLLPHSRNLRRISFSIPEEKIVRQLPAKTKLWPRHIVDPEVAARVPESRTSYAFSTEGEYYADLQASKFGITTKRAGWDCLRHYEIAANGCVPCFRDLHLKPHTCAPHGLQSDVNCLCYRNADDLLGQIGKVDFGRYLQLQEGALAWARANTTTAAACRLLAECKLLRNSCKH